MIYVLVLVIVGFWDSGFLDFPILDFSLLDFSTRHSAKLFIDAYNAHATMYALNPKTTERIDDIPTTLPSAAFSTPAYLPPQTTSTPLKTSMAT